MISLFGFAPSLPPVPLRSYQPPPLSPLGKHATPPVVSADESNSSASQIAPLNIPPVAVCHPEKHQPSTVDTKPLPSLDQLLPEINGVAGDNSAVSGDNYASISPPSCSNFPVFGPFDLLRCLQHGGYGDAWAARDRSTGRVLCLKMFHSLRDEDTKKSVHRELRMFKRIMNSKRGESGRQFIMEMNRSMQYDDTVFFAMELMAMDLGNYMFAERESCRLHTRRWMAQLALGIESLHEMGILHRDFKTENILVDCRENVRIIDFGLSYLGPVGKPLRRGGEYAIEFLGTPPYMAPEVLLNENIPPHEMKRYGTAIDWWALGCILYELESEGHQLLFDTEADVRAYVDWTRDPCSTDQVYPRFDGLSRVAVDLLEGLLHVQPSIRYSLKELEKHAYFLRRSGYSLRNVIKGLIADFLISSSEFENAAARALERPIRPELVPQFGDYLPVMVVEAASSNSIYDWTNPKWALNMDG